MFGSKHILIKLWDLTDSMLLLTSSLILANIKETLGVIALVLTIGYTLWKWNKEFVESVKKLEKEERETVEINEEAKAKNQSQSQSQIKGRLIKKRNK